MTSVTAVMGIINVTPDSFSDGGNWATTDAAIAHGYSLVSQGAEILDVGGESTRPGAVRVSAEEEAARVVPVIQALAASGALVSVDTMRASVAAAAIRAGACLVNDVSGGLADPEMIPMVADAGVDYVVMHWRGHSDVMTSLADYQDVVAEVRDELLARVVQAEAAGIRSQRIIIDVGLGFAKEPEHNWTLLQHLGEFNDLGYRQLVGASRKRFLGELTGRQAPERDAATAAVTMWCAQQGVWAVRTHEVAAQRDAISVAMRLRTGLNRSP